ncbi:MAG: hypothetical protein ACTHMU_05950, partial [Thermomicrobiales bacterium]
MRARIEALQVAANVAVMAASARFRWLSTPARVWYTPGGVVAYTAASKGSPALALRRAALSDVLSVTARQRLLEGHCPCISASTP